MSDILRIAISSFVAILLVAGLPPAFSQARDTDKAPYERRATDEEIAEALQHRQRIDRTRWNDSLGRTPMTYEEWQAEQVEPEPLAIKKEKSIGSFRGPKFCIVVDYYIQGAIQASLDQYTADLVDSGFTVEQYSSSGGTPESFRAFLLERYNEGTEGCLLVGDFPIPYFEATWPDDQTYEIFPCDLFFMDLDGTFEDTDQNGVYDLHTGDQYPEIYVGRLTAAPMTFNGADEVSLLQNYFRKNHDFRIGALRTNYRALVYIDDDWVSECEWWDEDVGLAYCARETVCDEETTIASDYENRLVYGHEFVEVAVHSSPSGHHFMRLGSWDGYTSNSKIASMSQKGIFFNLFACSNARYDTEDYMGGWYIFGQEYGLAALGSTKSGSMLNFGYFYGPFGQEASFGESFRDWFNEMVSWGMTEYDVCWYYGMTLLGDPTLKRSHRRPVEITTTHPPCGRFAMTYFTTLMADGGGAPPYQWTIIDGDLPAGLMFNPDVATISGMPYTSGTFPLTITADDICLPTYSDTCSFNIEIIRMCGDGNGDNNITEADLADLFDYLYSDGQNLDPVAGADIDRLPGVSNNDAQFYSDYFYHGGSSPYCPPFVDTVLPVSFDDTLAIIYNGVPPGESQWTVQMYMGWKSDLTAFSIPLAFACSTSALTCTEISYAGSPFADFALQGSRIDNVAQRAAFGFVRTDEPIPAPGDYLLASLTFSINPAADSQFILIDTAACDPVFYPVFTTPGNHAYLPAFIGLNSIGIEPEEPSCGDTYADGSINILDIIYLINFRYKGGPAPEPMSIADVNGDGDVNILDIIYLINYKFKDGPEPACP